MVFDLGGEGEGGGGRGSSWLPKKDSLNPETWTNDTKQKTEEVFENVSYIKMK